MARHIRPIWPISSPVAINRISSLYCATQASGCLAAAILLLTTAWPCYLILALESLRAGDDVAEGAVYGDSVRDERLDELASRFPFAGGEGEAGSQFFKALFANGVAVESAFCHVIPGAQRLQGHRDINI